MSLRVELTNQLKKVHGIEEKLWSAHPGFTSFNYRGKEVAHFDSNNELDVRLTKKIIKQESLEHPRDSTKHPNRYRSKSHWIVLPFRRRNHINDIVRLVKLAISCP